MDFNVTWHNETSTTTSVSDEYICDIEFNWPAVVSYIYGGLYGAILLVVAVLSFFATHSRKREREKHSSSVVGITSKTPTGAAHKSNLNLSGDGGKQLASASESMENSAH